MTAALPNPFNSYSALDLAESAAGPCLTDPMDPAAVLIPESALPPACHQQQTPITATDVVVPLAASVATDLSNDTAQVVEYFSDYAKRRCMDKISPPLATEPREFKPDFDALAAAMDIHPRDLDRDPAPLFLRRPRKVFLQALFRAGGLR